MVDPAPTLTPDEFASRIISPDSFVADAAAFVDVRLPRSQGKLSYSFIGPGVSQNPDQIVNISDPHGFNIGAAAMGPGVVNSPHMHFTAEVFICKSGRWRFDIGANAEQSIEVGPGDVMSVPTWVFRGFTNIGTDHGFLYTVLGGDDTGGIVWAPSVLREAADTGLYLSTDGAVIEADADASPAGVIEPLTDAELAALDSYSDDELRSCRVTSDDLGWSDHALLSSVAGSHRCAVAPVIGYGITQDRAQSAPITSRHGFSVDWLELEPGASTGVHRSESVQVLIVFGAGADIALHTDASVHEVAQDGAIVSIPGDVWRNYTNRSDEPLRLLVVSSGDAAPKVEWTPEIIAEAEAAGWALDANAMIAPTKFLPAMRSRS